MEVTHKTAPPSSQEEHARDLLLIVPVRSAWYQRARSHEFRQQALPLDMPVVTADLGVNRLAVLGTFTRATWPRHR